MTKFETLVTDVRSCTICKNALPDGVRPVFQVHPNARILIAGQAPGRKVHESGIPFDDASGKRLREWLGISREIFYNPKKSLYYPWGFVIPEQTKMEIFHLDQSANLLGAVNYYSNYRI